MKRTKPLTAEEALSRAAGLCARCEQCTTDLLKKMAAWGIPAGEAQKLIKQLKGMNFVDDARYARAYAHDRLAYSGWGRNKIIQGLWAKRLSREDIDQSMDEIDEEEYASVAERVIRARVRLSKEGASTYESKLKILKFAMQRGFESRLASSIINRIARELSEQEDDKSDK